MAKKKPRTKNEVLDDSIDVVIDENVDSKSDTKTESRWHRFKKRLKNEDDEPVIQIDGAIKDNKLLNDVRPKEGYCFHSDYFEIDDKYAKIVTFVNKGSSKKTLPIFWGINLIPQGLQQEVTVILLKSVEKMSESWIEDRQQTADNVTSFNENETKKSTDRKAKHDAEHKSSDIDIIARELMDGASYLNIHFRLMLKANSLDALEKAEAAVIRWYSNKFATLKIETYEGRQRRELATLLAPNYLKNGKGFYMTSTELAGNYNLVTQGLSDPTGSYLGNMEGDVNNSGVLMDIDDFSSHVVIAGDKKLQNLNKQFMSDLWALKLSNATIMNNKRVIHIVLNNADLDNVGMKRKDGSFIDLSLLTSKINMNEGDVNPLEIFGTIDPETGLAPDELTAFSSHVKKLTLMLKQLRKSSDQEIVDGYMSKVINEYYEMEGMWVRNAKERRDELRVVGLPHTSYPRLSSMVQTLERMHKSELEKGERRDPNDLKAVNIIKSTFESLLNTDGDLFDVYTNDVIDNAEYSRRVIYDFSSLRDRGVGLAMAQLVNVLDFATRRIQDGDLLIIHGVEFVSPSVREYMSEVVDGIISRGGRIAYIYNNVEKMLNERDFNKFDSADYTSFGYMSKSVFDTYIGILKQTVPETLVNLVTSKHSNRFYVRRGTDNIVFAFDPKLSVKGVV
jgi:putative uncharacterized protein cgl1841